MGLFFAQIAEETPSVAPLYYGTGTVGVKAMCGVSRVFCIADASHVCDNTHCHRRDEITNGTSGASYRIPLHRASKLRHSLPSSLSWKHPAPNRNPTASSVTIDLGVAELEEHRESKVVSTVWSRHWLWKVCLKRSELPAPS